MKSTIKFFSVNCGDAIRIIQRNGKGKTEGNILIDSGYIGTYSILREGIKDIIDEKKTIDLWVLTHLDADHINGAIEFLRDQEIKNKGRIIKELLFNFSNHFEIPNSSEFVSFAKGRELRKHLNKERINYRNKIYFPENKIRINSATITILSPDKKTYEELKDYWDKEEEKYRENENETFSAVTEDFDKYSIKRLSKFPDHKISKKKELANRSSIAFIYQSFRNKVLFLGDAIPSVIIESLKALGYSKKKRLKVKYIKLSHHGSRANYSSELLDYIECNEFIISANGINSHGIPDKEVLAKIIVHNQRNFKKKIKFYFNHHDDRFKTMFDVDEDDREKYNFQTIFPKLNKPLKLKF